MARGAPRPCTYPGCPAVVERGSRCPEHPRPQRDRDLAASRRYDRWRGGANARGYDATWSRVRAAKLRRDPLCERCKREGRRPTPADLVHHILPLEDGGARLDPANLESVCNSCHQKEHADLERAKRRR